MSAPAPVAATPLAPPAAAIAAPPAARPAALVVLLLGSTLTVMAGAVLSPVLAVVRADLGLTGTAAGLVLTMHGLVIAVTSPAVGWVVDRWGPRGPLAAGLVVYGLGGGAGLVATSYPALIASRVVFGVGASAVFTATTVALLDLYRGAQRDRVMGWRSTATSLGGVLWPLVGGALGGLSWHAPFAVYLVGVPLGLATALTLPRHHSSSGGSASGGSDGGDGGVLRLLRQRPRILGQYALLTVSTVLLYGLVVLMPLRLAEVGVRSSFLVAVLTVGMSVAMSLAGLAYAGASARWGPTRLLRGTYAAYAGAFVLLASTGSLPLVVAAQALFGLGMGLAVPALTVLLGASSPDRLQGRVLALSGTAVFVGQFLSPLLLGPLTDATTITTGFWAAAGLAAAVLAVLLVTSLDPRPGPSPEPTRGPSTGDAR